MGRHACKHVPSFRRPCWACRHACSSTNGTPVIPPPSSRPGAGRLCTHAGGAGRRPPAVARVARRAAGCGEALCPVPPGAGKPFWPTRHDILATCRVLCRHCCASSHARAPGGLVLVLVLICFGSLHGLARPLIGCAASSLHLYRRTWPGSFVRACCRWRRGGRCRTRCGACAPSWRRAGARWWPALASRCAGLGAVLARLKGTQGRIRCLLPVFGSGPCCMLRHIARDIKMPD